MQGYIPIVGAGAGTVFTITPDGDVNTLGRQSLVLDCNTAVAPVVINLPLIQNANFGGQFEFQVKVKNSIPSGFPLTLVAGAGQLINGLPAVIIAVAGEMGIVTMSNKTNYGYAKSVAP